MDGTHNLENAIGSLESRNAKFTLNQTETPGILDLDYIYAKESTGKLISGSKTVYDPAVFSDQKMLNYSLNAGKQGWEQYLVNPSQRIFDVTHEGVNFRIYINTDKYGNDFIGNVHPIK